MTVRTCAACDCELGVEVIEVSVGRNTVEVCCEECARKLGEAVDSIPGEQDRQGGLSNGD
jgi:hypothetical protein